MAMPATFIIDCPNCRAKVVAVESGRVQQDSYDPDVDDMPSCRRLHIGKCPRCNAMLAGESTQTSFEGLNADFDVWSDPVRVYPNPPKTFSSGRIPRVVTDSLLEADRSLKAGANIAACVMLGRSLEAVCHDIINSHAAKSTATKTRTAKKNPTLAQGITQLRDLGVIDQRLYEWSQELRAFRNLGAHPVDTAISLSDAEDLHSFAYAIVEYVYDLSDRYEEFKCRVAKRAQRKKP